MHARIGRILTTVVGLVLLISACSGGTTTNTNSEDSTFRFQGILLHENSILVTDDAGGIIDYKGEQIKGSEPGPLPGQYK
ncbi:MAG: hypothetical protein PHE41_04920 [Eubacteriales bacterium]|nr:hypothetical protein [Eubacteriales bacterium]